MYCKYCGSSVDDNAAFCSACGKALTEPAAPAPTAAPPEVHVHYTTVTSDRSKKKAIRLLLSGLGLHLFYVGKVFRGIIRLLIGLMGWAGLLAGWIVGDMGVFIAAALWMLFFNIIDLIQLLLGNFRDSSGAYLRT